MRFDLVRPFRDPRTRPRAVIWALVALQAFVVVWAAGIIGTCPEWFCTRPCHKVHDDNTLAYKASTHMKVSCIACHEPLNADPLLMTYMKIYVLPDLAATLFNTYEVPVNPASHVAVEFPDERCTQCHNLRNRTVTPSRGILIDHTVHTKKGVTCATCHNRVAHPEKDIKLVLGDRKHDDWMSMDACFRCHSLAQGAKAPGTCTACHPKGFTLVPSSHAAAKGWHKRFGESRGHAKAAQEESASIAKAVKAFSEEGPVEADRAEGPVLAPSSSVNSCFTCHKPSFCGDCHRLPMPHPAGFEKTHSEAGYAAPRVCARCHASSAADARRTAFCTRCHHPQSTPGKRWRRQHPTVVAKDGTKSCKACHDTMYCETCHVSGLAAAERYARSRRKK